MTSDEWKVTSDEWKVESAFLHFLFFYYWRERIAHALSLSNLLPKGSVFSVGYRATSSWDYKHELQARASGGGGIAGPQVAVDYFIPSDSFCSSTYT